MKAKARQGTEAQDKEIRASKEQEPPTPHKGPMSMLRSTPPCAAFAPARKPGGIGARGVAVAPVRGFHCSSPLPLQHGHNERHGRPTSTTHSRHALRRHCGRLPLLRRAPSAWPKEAGQRLASAPSCETMRAPALAPPCGSRCVAPARLRRLHRPPPGALECLERGWAQGDEKRQVGEGAPKSPRMSAASDGRPARRLRAPLPPKSPRPQ